MFRTNWGVIPRVSAALIVGALFCNQALGKAVTGSANPSVNPGFQEPISPASHDELTRKEFSGARAEDQDSGYLWRLAPTSPLQQATWTKAEQSTHWMRSVIPQDIELPETRVLKLELPAGTLRATGERVAYTDEYTEWLGRIDGQKNGLVLITEYRDSIFANISSVEGAFYLESRQEGFRLSQVDFSSLAGCGIEVEPPVAHQHGQADLAKTNDQTEAGSHSESEPGAGIRAVAGPLSGVTTQVGAGIRSEGSDIIDLMILYSQRALDEYGSQDQLINSILQARNYANVALENSNMITRFGSAANDGQFWIGIAPFQEPAGATQNQLLDALRNNNTVTNWRNTDFPADLIGLVSYTQECTDLSCCGLAWGLHDPLTPENNESLGYSVTAIDGGSEGFTCLGGGTLAHELGHNLGLGHTPNDNCAGGYHDYSCAHVIIDDYITVVGDPTSCPGCERIPYFSNPNVWYDGSPTGTSSARNHQTGNQTYPVVMQYRWGSDTGFDSAQTSDDTVSPGDSFEISYFFSDTAEPVGVILGASIAPGGTTDFIEDGDNDELVQLSSGTNIPVREFNVPNSVAEGWYDLYVSVWYDVDGDGQITEADQRLDGGVLISGIYVEESVCEFEIDPLSASYGSGGGQGQFDVSTGAGCDWEAESDDGWISVDSGGSGSGSGAVGYSVNQNTSTSARSGTIIVAGTEFTVYQDGVSCTYSIDPESTNIGAGGGAGSISVFAQSGCSWSAESDAGWISVTSGSTGSGNGTVEFSVDENISASARSGTITVAGAEFTVYQDGVSCTYSIDPESTNIGAGGGTGSTSVFAQSGCSWSAESDAGWISVTSGSTGSGNGTVDYAVDENTSTIGRTGTVTIAGNTFTVSQDGEDASTYALHVHAAGAAEVSITSSPAGYSGVTNYTIPDIKGGTAIELTAPMTSGVSNFGGWSGCDSTSGASDQICEIAIEADRTVTAIFGDTDNLIFHNRFELAGAIGDVVGVRFHGVVEGISGTPTWASDLRMDLTSSAGPAFSVGGYGGDAGEVEWDFQGSVSDSDGYYESHHPAAFEVPASNEDSWELSFTHTWQDVMTWSDLEIELLDPYGSGAGSLCVPSMTIEGGETKTFTSLSPQAHFPVTPYRIGQHNDRSNASAHAEFSKGRARTAGDIGTLDSVVPVYSTTGWDSPGYISLNAQGDGSYLVIEENQPTHIYAATFIGNDFSSHYGLASPGGSISQDTLIRIDTVTGGVEELGVISGSPGDVWTSMKWDHVTESVYASTSDALYEIDLDGLSASKIGPIQGGGLGADAIIISIAISPQGLLYGIDIVDDVFVAIDKNSGNSSVIGPLGVSPSFAQDMDFDQGDGSLYWGGYFGGGDSQLMTIDTDTGQATSLAHVEGGTELLSFTIANPAAGSGCSKMKTVSRSVSRERGSASSRTRE